MIKREEWLFTIQVKIQDKSWKNFASFKFISSSTKCHSLSFQNQAIFSLETKKIIPKFLETQTKRKISRKKLSNFTIINALNANFIIIPNEKVDPYKHLYNQMKLKKKQLKITLITLKWECSQTNNFIKMVN